ncbi:Gfo/Idh/MocA family oxidoreductase [Streptomyces sp. NBC_01511]|uniref:Gfo/Idh/MocA family protein n=1 Tax=Streptomyces sp. NBC_01511 TaxID=2903889 RepID=UPI0038677DA8
MRWAVAGYGDIVTRRVLPALRELGEEPVALWGRDAARAALVAGRHGVPSSGDDPRVLFEGTDAVYVATPVVRHLPFLAGALAAGCHVLVEKPLAGALPYGPGPGPESQPGPGLGPEPVPAGLCAGVAYYRRLAPAVRLLRRELSGFQGAVRARVMFRCAFAPEPGHPMRWRTDPAVSGGGVLADAGCHRLDLLLTLFGRPAEVRARLGGRFPLGAERRAELDLRWESGTHAHCVFEWGDAAPADRFTVTAGRRTLALDPLDTGRLRVTSPTDTWTRTLPPPANPHLPLIADFTRAATAGLAPVCPVAEARAVDEVIVAAQLSDAAGGRPVRP